MSDPAYRELLEHGKKIPGTEPFVQEAPQHPFPLRKQHARSKEDPRELTRQGHWHEPRRPEGAAHRSGGNPLGAHDPVGQQRIRVTQDKKFKFPDNTEDTQFEGVIVDFVVTRSFYEGTYDPNIQPPACFRHQPDLKGMAPSNNSPVKQSDSCDTCPNNQFGSGQGNSKACKEGRKLALLPADADADAPIWPLVLSPTAVRAFDGYIQGVGRQFNVPPVGVRDPLRVRPVQLPYASVRCDNPVPNENPLRYARQAEAQQLLNVEPDTSKYGQEPPARTRAPAAARNAVTRR